MVAFRGNGVPVIVKTPMMISVTPPGFGNFPISLYRTPDFGPGSSPILLGQKNKQVSRY